MSDVTQEFKDIVASLRTSGGAVSEARGGEDDTEPPLVLPPFTRAARTALDNLEELRDYLEGHVHAYAATSKFAQAVGGTMTDQQRDDIDDAAIGFMKDCGRQIDVLKQKAHEDKHASEDVRAHREGLITYLYERLRSVGSLLSQQRKLRMKQLLKARDRLATVDDAGSVETSEGDASGESADERDAVGAPRRTDTGALESLDADDDWMTTPSERELSQMQAENHALAAKLQNDVQAVRSMEQKLVEIAELVQTFSERVVEQHKEIENLYDTASRSRDSINKANEELVVATQHSANFRVFTLMFLVIASALLFFFDRYA